MARRRRKSRGGGYIKFGPDTPTEVIRYGYNRGKKLAHIPKEEGAFLIRTWARLKCLGIPVRSALDAAYMAEYGKPLTDHLYNYYATSPGTSARRYEALMDLRRDPEIFMTLTPERNAAILDDLIKQAATPRVVGIQQVRVLKDGKWQDEVHKIEKADLTAAHKFMETKLKLLQASGSLSAFPIGGQTIPHNVIEFKKKSESEMFEAVGMADEEGAKIKPEDMAVLKAEENQPFSMPPASDVTMRYEDHAKMMARWDKEGVPPPGSPVKPTRVVAKDGAVTILQGDEDFGGDGEGLAEKKLVEVEQGEAILDPEP